MATDQSSEPREGGGSENPERYSVETLSGGTPNGASTGPHLGLEGLCAALGSIWAECLWTEFRPAGALLQRSEEGNVVMDAVGRPANHPRTRVPATTTFSPIRSSTCKAAEPWQSRAGFGVGRDHGRSDSDD